MQITLRKPTFSARPQKCNSTAGPIAEVRLPFMFPASRALLSSLGLSVSAAAGAARPPGLMAAVEPKFAPLISAALPSHPSTKETFEVFVCILC